MGTPTIVSAVSDTTGEVITITFSEAVTGTTGFTYSHDIFSVPGIFTQPTGSGTVWTMAIARPSNAAGSMKLWYTSGNFKSVSTNTDLANISSASPVLITNNIEQLNFSTDKSKFEIFLDPGYRNPPRYPQYPFRNVYQAGSCITWNYSGSDMISFQLDISKIDAACSVAAVSGLNMVWDNEFAPTGSSVLVTAEGARQSLKELYLYCKQKLTDLGEPNISVSHYNFPHKTFWGINSMFGEITINDRPPTLFPAQGLDSYEAYVESLDRVNKRCTGITVTESEITPGLFTIANNGTTTLVDDEFIWADWLCPDNYAYYDDVRSHVEVASEILRLFKDKFTRNNQIPIYPYIWFQFHENTPSIANWTQGEYFWRQTVNFCRERGDGAIIWGGYGIGRPMSYMYRSSSSYDRAMSATATRFSSVDNGCLRFLWMKQYIDIKGLDFTGVSTANIDGVATILETAINAAKPTITDVNYNVDGTEHLQSSTGITLSQPANIVVDYSDYHGSPGHIVFYNNNDYSKTLLGRSATALKLEWPYKRITYDGSNVVHLANLSSLIGWTVTTSSPVTISRKIQNLDTETEDVSSVTLASVIHNSLQTDWDCGPLGYNFEDTIADSLLAPSINDRLITYTFTNTSSGAVATVVFNNTTCDGTFLGAPEYLDIANGLEYYYEHPYAGIDYWSDEFDQYIEPTDWWQATLDLYNKVRINGGAGVEYVKSLKPSIYVRMPSSSASTITDYLGSGHDFLFFNQQYVTNPAGHGSYPSAPSITWGTKGQNPRSYGVDFNGNKEALNQQPSGDYSTGGFLHYSPPVVNRLACAIGLSKQWTTVIWFKPSSVPLTSGEQSYILYCGYSNASKHKCKGPTFIYDDFASTYNNGTSTVAYPSGPKLVWDWSSDENWSTTTAKTILPVNFNFSANKWHMITSRFDYDTLEWSVFVNGVLDNTVTLSSPASRKTWRWQENTWAVNAFDTNNNTSGSTSRSNHTIGELIVFRKYLNDEEIYKIYKSNSNSAFGDFPGVFVF